MKLLQGLLLLWAVIFMWLLLALLLRGVFVSAICLHLSHSNAADGQWHEGPASKFVPSMMGTYGYVIAM